jgi:hypothetical protein
VNELPVEEKIRIYSRFVPRQLLELFRIQPDLIDAHGRRLATFRCSPGTTDVVVDLRHEYGAPDPLLYAHLTDTVTGQVHVLLYIVNDPASERFDVDRLPDGSKTEFGTLRRNLPAEEAAMAAGLAPGQVRRGLRMLGNSVLAFEEFVSSLGHEAYFVEPLAYHNAIVFERYGFGYQQGRRLMEQIHAGFAPGGALRAQLDGSSAFRRPTAADSILGRSWAIHDGILGHPYTDVTMYKRVGKSAGVSTYPEGAW